MGDLSAAGQALLRRWLLTDSAAPRPTAWRLALYTSAPTDAGGGTEVTAAGYARQVVVFDEDGAANDEEVVFGPALADWGTITHAGLFDNTGRFLAWRALAAAKTVPSGDSLRFAVGAISAEFD